MALIVQVEIIRRTEKKTTHLGDGKKSGYKITKTNKIKTKPCK